MHLFSCKVEGALLLKSVFVIGKVTLVKHRTPHGVQVLPFRIGSGAGVLKEEGGLPRAIEPRPLALNFATPNLTS